MKLKQIIFFLISDLAGFAEFTNKHYLIFITRAFLINTANI